MHRRRTPLPSTVSYVFFDLDDTLLDHRTAERKALVDLYASVKELSQFESPAVLQDAYHRVNTEVWIQYSKGILKKSEARVVRFHRLLNCLNISDNVLGDWISERYLENYSLYWDWIPGARDAFTTISGVCPVGILTNGFAEVQQQKLSRFSELNDLPHCVVISEKAGYMKPDPRIFQYASEMAETRPSEILYVGDSLRSDVRGGKKAGWMVAWFRRDYDPAGAAQTAGAMHEENNPASSPELTADLVFSDWSAFISILGPSLIKQRGQNP